MRDYAYIQFDVYGSVNDIVEVGGIVGRGA
jgi:hypothetical protein